MLRTWLRCHLDINLVVVEDVIRYIAEGERRKLVFNQDGKAPRIVTCAIDTALVFIDDMFFMPKESGRELDKYYEKYCKKKKLILIN